MVEYFRTCPSDLQTRVRAIQVSGLACTLQVSCQRSSNQFYYGQPEGTDDYRGNPGKNRRGGSRMALKNITKVSEEHAMLTIIYTKIKYVGGCPMNCVVI
jgi:hypothetical protein